MVSFRHCEEPLRRSNDGSHAVIASEAKQPRGRASNRLGCLASLAVTSRIASRDMLEREGSHASRASAGGLHSR
jgi:hypothetical protein